MPGLDLKPPPRSVWPLAEAKHWRKAKLELQQQKVRPKELVRPLRTERPLVLAMAKRLRKVMLELDLKLQPRMEIPQKQG